MKLFSIPMCEGDDEDEEDDVDEENDDEEEEDEGLNHKISKYFESTFIQMIFKKFKN